MKDKKVLFAVFALVGMIIGVGTFGIPYAFSQSGFLIGFFYLVGFDLDCHGDASFFTERLF